MSPDSWTKEMISPIGCRGGNAITGAWIRWIDWRDYRLRVRVALHCSSAEFESIRQEVKSSTHCRSWGSTDVRLFQGNLSGKRAERLILERDLRANRVTVLSVRTEEKVTTSSFGGTRKIRRLRRPEIQHPVRPDRVLQAEPDGGDMRYRGAHAATVQPDAYHGHWTRSPGRAAGSDADAVK
ncbi:uncharacterized protein LOC134221330 [Armigeres subalbatus]|uniref:uncharacterized protein LOC134221330 n=1 Tax=Armigeres subalbatus TaxID=124917 RepID=UPI002ED2B172